MALVHCVERRLTLVDHAPFFSPSFHFRLHLISMKYRDEIKLEVAIQDLKAVYKEEISLSACYVFNEKDPWVNTQQKLVWPAYLYLVLYPKSPQVNLYNILTEALFSLTQRRKNEYGRIEWL